MSSGVNRLESFAVQADSCGDATTAADLRFAATLAAGLGSAGGRALAVGGYPRDLVMARLGRANATPKDLDLEVYGVEFSVLIELLAGFGRTELVGASFGVAKLVNPATGSILDVSVPRVDSKVAPGHRWFAVVADPSMSVREAARRRDLTVNSLALDPLTGQLIDEHGGVRDLEAGLLRATDPTLFGDDPLRVLRVAQFAGRFGFDVDPATAQMCRGLDLGELPAERVGEEWRKLMTKSPRPSVGLQVARELGVLAQLHPELEVLDTVPQEPDWHPEGDVWTHSVFAADAAARIVREEALTGEEALVVLFGALCHDLGKATTTERREKHGVWRITAHGHEAAGVDPSRSFLTALQMPHAVVDRILPIVRDHLYHVHNPEPTDRQLRRFALRLAPASIHLWDLVSRCDSNGKGGEFKPVTKSHALYRRSLELSVDQGPAPAIVQGRDLIAELGLKPGPSFGAILDFLYDAQLGGEIATVADGIAYYREHAEEIAALLEKRV